jgi:Tfp pilus assembly protein PilN
MTQFFDQPGQAYYEDVPAADHTVPYQEPMPTPPASLRLSEPKPKPKRQRMSPLTFAALLSGVAGLLLAAFCLWQMTALKTSIPTNSASASVVARQAQQITQLRTEVAGMQTTIKAYASLPAQLSTAQKALAKLAPYNKECSVPVTTNGAAANAYFRCTYSPQGS